MCHRRLAKWWTDQLTQRQSWTNCKRFDTRALDNWLIFKLQLQALGQPPSELFDELIPAELMATLSQQPGQATAADLLNAPGELDEKQFGNLLDSLLKQSGDGGADKLPDDCIVM